MWRLAGDCGGLDQNSPYAYMLAGLHFADTSVVATDPTGSVAGFVIAYRPPAPDNSVFVWQVAVADAHRGQGLAGRMIHHVVDRALRLGATSLTATVTPSNQASLNLFTSVARVRGATISQRPCFEADLFPDDGHEPEDLLVIEPLGPRPDTDAHLARTPLAQCMEGTP